MSGNNITEEKALEERAKFVGGFNGTMIDIWKEKIVDMGVIDTGALLDSVTSLPVRADGRSNSWSMVYGRTMEPERKSGGEIPGIYIPGKRDGRK